MLAAAFIGSSGDQVTNLKFVKKQPKKVDLTLEKFTGMKLIKYPGILDGGSCSITDLSNCSVYLYDHSSSIDISGCMNTKFYLGPIKGKLTISDCKDCEIAVPCGQLLCTKVQNTKIYLFCATDPNIEHSNHLVFAPYNFNYPQLAEHTEKVAFNKFENCWNAVSDLTADDKLGAKSYSFLNPNEFKYNHELPPVFPIDYLISPFSESKPPQTIFKHDTEFDGLRIVKIANINIKEA